MCQWKKKTMFVNISGRKECWKKEQVLLTVDGQAQHRKIFGLILAFLVF